jgi:hypothetical protein
MKKMIFIILFFCVASAFSMEKTEEECPDTIPQQPQRFLACIEPKNNGSHPDPAYVNHSRNGINILVKEKFDRYYGDLHDAQWCCSQKIAYVAIRKPLFYQLMVQAARITDNNKQAAFKQLLAKIQHKEIIDEGMVLLEPQDVRSILDSIPTGGTFSLINGKKIIMSFMPYQTPEDKTQPKAPIDDNLPRIIFPTYSAQELGASYQFEADHKHHDAIIEKYKSLSPY